MASTTDASATIEEIQRDIQALRNDIARLAGQVTELVSSGSGDAIGKLKEHVGRMQDGFDETLSGMGQRSREAVTDIYDRVGEALQDSLHEHPLATIGIALGLGFLFGTTWRR